MTLAKVITDLLSAKEVIDALGAGRSAVIHEIGDLADDYLQTISPPYAAAVELCNTAGQSVDCTNKRIALRDTVLSKLLETTGLIVLIDGMIAVWRNLPEDIRKEIVDGLSAVASLKDLISNPSVTKLIAVGSRAAAIVETELGSVVDDLQHGKIPVPGFVEWAGTYLAEGANAVDDVLGKFGLPRTGAGDIIEDVASGDVGALAADVFDPLHLFH